MRRFYSVWISPPVGAHLLSKAVFLAAVCLSFMAASDSARGELFLLVGGGRVQGRWLNREDRKAPDYLIETSQGVRLKLEKNRVDKRIRQNEAEMEYHQIASGYADTVEDQWRLASWCVDHNLLKLRKRSLQRIIELDSDHVAARRLLGYGQIGGHWKTKEEVNLEKGLVRYKGRWRYTQEIDLIENRQQRKQSEGQWWAKLKRMRENLDNKNHRSFFQNVSNIRDPYAVRGLGMLLTKENFRPLQKLYIETLGDINTGAALNVLFQASLASEDKELIRICVFRLKEVDPPQLTQAYAKSLQHENNDVINRAAYSLQLLKDSSAIPALIDALNTTHFISKERLRELPSNTKQLSPNQLTAAAKIIAEKKGVFASEGSEKVTVLFTNKEVLNTLHTFSNGLDYRYDMVAWKVWYAANVPEAPLVKARRD